MTSPHLSSVSKRLIEILGKTLSLARKNRHWRQIDLAERVGVTRQTITRIERGDPTVAIGTYFNLAWVLDVPIFPGMELRDPRSNDIVKNIITLLQEKLPKRISEQKKKRIDDNF